MKDKGKFVPSPNPCVWTYARTAFVISKFSWLDGFTISIAMDALLARAEGELRCYNITFNFNPMTL